MTDVPLPSMPDGPSPDQALLNGLRKRYLELAARAEEIDLEMKVIKDRLRQFGEGRHAAGDGYIAVTPQKRFDPDLADKVLREINPLLVGACSVTTIQSALVKKAVGDDVYERCQKPAGEAKVVIK